MHLYICIYGTELTITLVNASITFPLCTDHRPHYDSVVRCMSIKVSIKTISDIIEKFANRSAPLVKTDLSYQDIKYRKARLLKMEHDCSGSDLYLIPGIDMINHSTDEAKRNITLIGKAFIPQKGANQILKKVEDTTLPGQAHGSYYKLTGQTLITIFLKMRVNRSLLTW